MRKIYIAYSEKFICEGAFDQDGTLLDFWSNDEACWSDDFSSFMEKLGFQIVSNCPEWIIERLDSAAFERYGDYDLPQPWTTNFVHD